CLEPRPDRGLERNVDAALERIVDPEARDQGSVAPEPLDVDETTCPGSGDDFGLTVVVRIANSDAHASAETLLVGAEQLERLALGIEDADVGDGPGSGACDDLRPPVAVEISGADEDAAGVEGA